jgi:tetratricopeptide (TPR) repeat protein
MLINHKAKLGLLLLTFSAPILLLFSCKNNSSTTNLSSSEIESSLEFEKKVYEKAYEIGDHHTCVSAVTRILLLDSNQTHYYDSLTRHYLAISNANSSIYYAEKSLLLDPGNTKMLEMAGYVYFEAGSFQKSEEKFQKLYQITNDLKYVHQLSQIYGYMGNLEKANQMTDLIINNEEANDMFIDMASPDGQVQNIKIKAASWLVRANLAKSVNQAIASLNKALAIQPNFAVAKRMKEELEMQEAMEYSKKLDDRLKKYQK